MIPGLHINSSDVLDDAIARTAHGWASHDDFAAAIKQHMHEHSHDRIVIFVPEDVYDALYAEAMAERSSYFSVDNTHKEKYGSAYAMTYRKMPILTDTGLPPQERYVPPNTFIVAYYR